MRYDRGRGARPRCVRKQRAALGNRAAGDEQRDEHDDEGHDLAHA